MNFDFYEQFKNYETNELLLITKQPELYQPEAVAVAISLLQLKSITQEESDTVEHLVKEQVEETKKVSKENPIDQFLLSAKELLQPVMTRGVKVSAEHWLKLMMVVYTIQLTISACIIVWKGYLIGLPTRFFEGFSESLFFGFSYFVLALAVSTGIYILLYRRHRLGWILSFISGTISVSNKALQFLKSSYYLYGGDDWGMANDLFSLLINLGLILLLWKPDIAALFKVGSLTKKISLIVAGIIVGLSILVSW